MVTSTIANRDRCGGADLGGKDLRRIDSLALEVASLSAAVSCPSEEFVVGPAVGTPFRGGAVYDSC